VPRFVLVGPPSPISFRYSLAAKSVACDGSLLFLSIEPTGTSAVTQTYAHGIDIFPKAEDERRKAISLRMTKNNVDGRVKHGHDDSRTEDVAS